MDQNQYGEAALSLERRAYTDILPLLGILCNGRQIDPSRITFREGREYSSIYYKNRLLVQLKLHGSRHYISVPQSQDHPVEDSRCRDVVFAKGRLKLYLNHFDLEYQMSMVRMLILASVEQCQSPYGHCVRYVKCQEAGECLARKEETRKNCAYYHAHKNGETVDTEEKKQSAYFPENGKINSQKRELTSF
ncbi:MAG: hypothetical protein GXW99_02025 [Clostridiales bacterium]|nr:hypothetical protein [Clostridiales bacterium]